MDVIGLGSTHSSMSRSAEPDDIVREKSTPVTLLCRMVPLVESESGVLRDRRGRRQCRRSFSRLGGRAYGESVPDDSAFAYVAKNLHTSPRRHLHQPVYTKPKHHVRTTSPSRLGLFTGTRRLGGQM